MTQAQLEALRVAQAELSAEFQRVLDAVAESADRENLRQLAIAFRARKAELEKLKTEVEEARQLLLGALPVGKTLWEDVGATVSEVSSVRLDPDFVRRFHPRVWARCSRMETTLRLAVK